MSKWTEYGNALYDLAAEEGLEKAINQELADITQIFKDNTDFIKLLLNPRFPIIERTELLDKVFRHNIHPYLLSFLKILIEKRDIAITPIVYQVYQKLYYRNKDILPVTVISAIPLTEGQRQRIISKLEVSMKKTIILENRVDKACIGGIRLEYQGYLIDASIKTRLQNLQALLKKADYSQVEV